MCVWERVGGVEMKHMHGGEDVMHEGVGACGERGDGI